MPANRTLGFLALGLMLLALCVTAIPDETEVLFEGSDAAAWDRARDQARLDKEFNVDEITPAADPASILWRFNPKDTSFNDIFLRKSFSLRFSAIRVRVKNEGPALTLAAKIADADMAEWTAQTVHIDEGADWQWVEFPAEKWVVASWSKDADGKMDLPIQYFTLIAFDLANGTEYKLRVSRVEVVSPDRPVATVQSIKLPATLRHGQTVQASLSFPPRQAVHRRRGVSPVPARRGRPVQDTHPSADAAHEDGARAQNHDQQLPGDRAGLRLGREVHGCSAHRGGPHPTAGEAG